MFDPFCSIEVEDTFGPTVASSCLHGFDFTLLFEEYILTLLPLSLVCLAAFIRIWKLQSASEKVNRSWSYAAKEVCGQALEMLTFFALTCAAILAPLHNISFSAASLLESTECPQNQGDSSDGISHDQRFSCSALLISSRASSLTTPIHSYQCVPRIHPVL
jgi:hypothetical protein